MRRRAGQGARAQGCALRHLYDPQPQGRGRRSDAEVLGCVFNNVYAASVSDRQSYGYGYGYGYGHGYGYGTQTEEDA